MGFLLLAFVVILVGWIINRWRSRAFIKLANSVPSNRWYTLLGWGKVLRAKDVLTSVFEYGSKYGPNSVFWMGPYPLFLTSDPETLREVLTSKNCVNKPLEFYSGLVSVGGQGLITESDPVWSQHRKFLNKAFSNKNLLSFLPTFNAEIDKFVVELEDSVDKGEDIDLLVILRVLSLKNATRTTLKRNLELTKFNSESMAIYFEQILQFLADFSLHQVLAFNWIRSLFESHVYKSAREGIRVFLNLFDESLNIAQKNNTNDESYLNKENSILDCVLKELEQNGVSKENVQGLLMQFFAAAFETTSTTLFFALSLLAMNPEYQQRVHEEVSKVLNDTDDELTINQLDDLTYIDMIFNETMRLLPIVPMVFRKVSNEDFHINNDVTLPVDQIIAIDIFRLHRDKEIWGPEAETFNPNNFLPSNVAARHPYSFIPFTKGQRFCIGWRYGTLFFKIALAKLIAKFRFSTDSEFKNLRYENHITLKLVEEPRLKLERRQVQKNA